MPENVYYILNAVELHSAYYCSLKLWIFSYVVKWNIIVSGYIVFIVQITLVLMSYVVWSWVLLLF